MKIFIVGILYIIVSGLILGYIVSGMTEKNAIELLILILGFINGAFITPKVANWICSDRLED